jgi:Tfp pilus assembly protein PilF
MRLMPKISCRARAAGWVAIALAALLGACATPRPADPPVDPLLHDGYFAPSHEHIDAASVFALSDAMRRYADSELIGASSRRAGDPRHALLDALYTHGHLQLRYDAGGTRTAAQAFDARAGNCLSLVIMTAAFAKYLGLPVSYQRVQTPASYSLSGELVFASGHVNLVLGSTRRPELRSWPPVDEMTVDFLPPTELGTQRTERLDERTIVAMYFNNRAGEALADGHLADSYAWARAAVLQDPSFGAAANTLAVVYLQAGHPAAAEVALRFALAREPANASALSNLVTALQRQNREAEAQAVVAQLARIQPVAPFHYFELGRQAMASGDYRRASALFARELQQQPDQPEVHFWAALADWRLGDNTAASEHLRRARDFSLTPAAHDLFAAKLARLRAQRVQ